MNAWDDTNFVAAIKAYCPQEDRPERLVDPRPAWRCRPSRRCTDGYEVYVAEDCCGDRQPNSTTTMRLKRVIPGRCEDPSTALSTMLGMASANWALKDTYDAGDGHREGALRRLRHRRRIRLHDGPRRGTHQAQGVGSRRSPWCTREALSCCRSARACWSASPTA